MKLFSALILAASMLFLSGCGNLSPRDNFSPRQQQEIDNRDGRINGEIKNMANSVNAEILKLQQNDEIQNSNIDRMQKGMVNLQSNYDNSGVQILSGPGGLMFALVALLAAFLMCWHYRKDAKLSEKASEILAGKIAEKQDPALEDEVFKAAMFTDVEERVFHLMMKNKKP